MMQTPFEKDDNTTAEYSEVVAFYQKLSASKNYVQVNNFGITDIGEPLQEVIIDKDGLQSPEEIRAKGRAILFINNAIHPGEPCGVDASMIFVRDLKDNKKLWKALDDVSIVLIPIYNIGGAINRNSHSRANQVGPKAYGFRGNFKNYDLNRDFVKCDTKNGQSFNKLFTKWSPDIMIDNHTSNGADYQYVMTLITTLEDKISPSLGRYLRNSFVPRIYEDMKNDRYDMIPYVDMIGKTPEEGIQGFVDYGRYSSGYAALHHTIAFMPETHMLKPFKDRVWSTYDFMKNALCIIADQKDELLKAREEAFEYYKNIDQAPIQWKIDKENPTTIEFKGYQSGYKKSLVSGLDRLYYDRSKPYTMTIPFYDKALVTKDVDVPSAYIVPQGYTKVLERLAWNNVKTEMLQDDREIEVEVYYIKDYTSTSRPYEGHYLHYNVDVEKKVIRKKYRKGDVIVPVHQAAARYIIETLEPQAADSYFNWNFMDAILQQKEYFSSYVFEDLAADYLSKNPELRAELEKKKEEDEEFAKSGYAQLMFVYKRSPHYEKTHTLYPISRIK